jgi:hypothetical protein
VVLVVLVALLLALPSLRVVPADPAAVMDLQVRLEPQLLLPELLEVVAHLVLLLPETRILLGTQQEPETVLFLNLEGVWNILLEVLTSLLVS